MIMLTVIIIAIVIIAWKYGVSPPDGTKAGTGTSVLDPGTKDRVLGYKQAISHWSGKVGVKAPIIAGIIAQESEGVQDVIGGSGEVGLMQVKSIAYRDVIENGMMPSYLDYSTVPDDPWDNIEIGTKYYKLNLIRTDGDEFEALRFYNAGPGRAGSNMLISRNYANTVLDYAKEFERHF